MSSPDYDYLFKLLIIGDSGVGKSSLLLRYTDDTFSTQYFTTIGVDFKIKTIVVNGAKLKLQIWDTAGQERFRTITATYYRGAHGIIVVYDVNHGESFSNVKRWFEEIHNNCPANVAKMIVGNKDDNADTKAVPTADLQFVAQEFGVQCIETSAKLNKNVEQMFEQISEKILEAKRQSGGGSGGGASGGGDSGRGAAVRVTNFSEKSSSKKKCC